MQTEKEYLIGREIGALRSESVGEYSLPDYNGDVKKILLVKTKVFPNGKFVGEELLEFSGTVGYEVVYLDAENTVTHAEFSTDYDAAVRINSESYVDSDVKTSVSGCNIRLVGPRKISVKCMLDSDVVISERKSYGVGGDAFMEHEPETVTKSVSVLSTSFASGQSHEIKEEMVLLDGAIADEVEILLSDARTELDAVALKDGALELTGRTKVNVLYRNGDDSPRLVSRDLPYSAELMVDENVSCDEVEARVETVSLASSLTPTDDGVSISVAASVAPRAVARHNSSLDLIGDAYLKERGSSNEYTDLAYTEHICTERCESRFEAKGTLSDLGIENPGDVLYAEAVARIENLEHTESGICACGEIRFSGIECHSSDECNMCVPVKFSLPFKQNVKLNCQLHNNVRVNHSVSVNNVKIEMDENNVAVSCDLTISLDISSEKKQRCLGASYLTDEEYTRDESVVTVYYPDAGESLFGIAKRFHTSVDAIARDNRLSESVFASSQSPLGSSGVKRLIIK